MINSRNKRGFTLIELLVVISIIGILAAFIVASFTSAQQKARDSKRKADLNALSKALELAKSDSAGTKYYPSTISTASLETPNYIKKIPVDPQTGASYTYAVSPVLPPCSANCTAYRLYAVLENTNDPQATDSGTTASTANTCPGSTDGFSITYPAHGYAVCQQ